MVPHADVTWKLHVFHNANPSWDVRPFGGRNTLSPAPIYHPQLRVQFLWGFELPEGTQTVFHPCSDQSQEMSERSMFQQLLWSCHGNKSLNTSQWHGAIRSFVWVVIHHDLGGQAWRRGTLPETALPPLMVRGKGHLFQMAAVCSPFGIAVWSIVVYIIILTSILWSCWNHGLEVFVLSLADTNLHTHTHTYKYVCTYTNKHSNYLNSEEKPYLWMASIWSDTLSMYRRIDLGGWNISSRVTRPYTSTN